MYIEKNIDAQTCTIWIDKEHSQDYKNDVAYKQAIADSKADGYSICVFVGGDMPLIPVLDEVFSPNPISA